jgi:hypothetical protein
MNLYMFRTVRLSFSSLFTAHSAMAYVIQLSSRTRMELQFILVLLASCLQTCMTYMTDSFWAGPGWNRVPSWSCSNAVYKPVWHIPLLSVQWINCWSWTEELSKTCRVSYQNKFVKLVHIVGFIIKKFVMMQHGHVNVKWVLKSLKK